MHFAINHMTVPHLSYRELINLAIKLNCTGVEVRNDIKNVLFDGLDPIEAGKIAADKGIRIIGLSQIYPFNRWNKQRKFELLELIKIAEAASAETISLIPANDGFGCSENERKSNLNIALRAILPILKNVNITALIEPLGFMRSSLRSKRDVINGIKSINGENQFKLVHDTSHHALTGGELFPESTGLVHISGVNEVNLNLAQMEDKHRVIIDEQDRLDNLGQLRNLKKAGYAGIVSYECFSPSVHSITNPYNTLKKSFEYILGNLN